jgi:hypothetical protein
MKTRKRKKKFRNGVTIIFKKKIPAIKRKVFIEKCLMNDCIESVQGLVIVKLKSKEK